MMTWGEVKFVDAMKIFSIVFGDELVKSGLKKIGAIFSQSSFDFRINLRAENFCAA